MRCRNFFGEVARLDAAFLQQAASVDAIGKDRFESSEPAPVLEGGLPAQERLHDDFVIASQCDDRGRRRASDETIDHPFGIGAAIDVVADIDLQRPIARAAFGDVAIDEVVRPPEAIGAPVDIADGVEKHSLGPRRVTSLATTEGA